MRAPHHSPAFVVVSASFSDIATPPPPPLATLDSAFLCAMPAKGLLSPAVTINQVPVGKWRMEAGEGGSSFYIRTTLQLLDTSGGFISPPLPSLVACLSH